jgi:hypothetical protein
MEDPFQALVDAAASLHDVASKKKGRSAGSKKGVVKKKIAAKVRVGKSARGRKEPSAKRGVNGVPATSDSLPPDEEDEDNRSLSRCVSSTSSMESNTKADGLAASSSPSKATRSPGKGTEVKKKPAASKVMQGTKQDLLGDRGRRTSFPEYLFEVLNSTSGDDTATGLNWTTDGNAFTITNAKGFAQHDMFAR